MRRIGSWGVETSDGLRKQVLRVNCPLYLYEGEEAAAEAAAEAAHSRTRACAIGNAVVATSTRPEPHPRTTSLRVGLPPSFSTTPWGCPEPISTFAARLHSRLLRANGVPKLVHPRRIVSLLLLTAQPSHSYCTKSSVPPLDASLRRTRRTPRCSI